MPSPPPPPSSESVRRLHALSELLSTELSYLVDLRTLVLVYLRLLPVLKSRSSSSNPTSGYFSRPPSLRTQSHPQLSSHSDPSATILSLPTKVTTRHLFSASDLDAITRNAEDILDLHERLVHQLRQAVSPFGISAEFRTENIVHVHRAINAVSTVFIDHASSFDQYQTFCSGHSEAFDLVRKVQHRYPAEWEAFEHRCATATAEMQSQDFVAPCSQSGEQLSDFCKRRHSLSSLDALSGENPKAHLFSASESGHTERDPSIRRPRLMFMDYMIKPVQRVCRYPLLFDQLQDRSVTHPSSPARQDAAKTALRTMRSVASLVDEARRQQELLVKSVQIVSRITQGLLTSVASHNRPLQSASLSTFLSSLGPCHLSGSLDVIHYHGPNMSRLGTVRAKYLGAFLFPGGFLVLVKIAKSKAYEPKHWFNLRGFELVDSNLDDVLLPSWFRLSSKAYMFEFAASCRREKDIWVEAIRHTTAEEASWNDEPPSSLHSDVNASVLGDVQFETISPLPTIQSIPEIDDIESAIPNPGDAPSFPPAQAASQVHLRAEDADVLVPFAVGPSRRSSVTSQTASMPESNTFHLVRSTASAREQVDRGLLDVFSEKCLTARFHAHTREEDLFEAQRVTRSFSKSTSALTMASAMSFAAKNRLTKRESVLVPRKRSPIEGNEILGDTEYGATFAYNAAPKTITMKQHPSKLKIVAITPHEGEDGANEIFLESPSPISHCSSVSFATPVAVPAPLSTPPVKAGSSHSEFLSVRQKDCVPKRSKSMIENVCGLFTPRTVSPTTSLTRESSTRSSVSNSSLLKWWSRESLRRRVRSAPDVPGESLPSTLTTRSLYAETEPRPLPATADRPYSQPDLHLLYSEPAESMLGPDDPSQQRRGMFSLRGPQRRWTASTERQEEDSTSAPIRIRRNFSFLNKFSRDYVDAIHS